MAKSLLHWGATLWGRPHRQGRRKVQLTERFYESVHPCSRVLRQYKILHLWWLQPTIYRKNWPHRSHVDSQEVVGDRSSYEVQTGDSIIIHIGCSDVIKFDSVTGSHVVWQVDVCCNQKIIVCRLPDADRQRYIDKFKSLGIDKIMSLQDSENWVDGW